MKREARSIVTCLLLLSHVYSALALESQGSAFMWSPHLDMELGKSVNYQTLSSKDLAKSVMSQGGWSNILCENEASHQSLDVAVVFIGKELRSLDLSRKRTSDAVLVNLLKDSFTASNFSAAYPYVSAKVSEGTLETSLVEEFEGSCNSNLRVKNIIFTESCSVDGTRYSKLADLSAVQEHVASEMEKGSQGQPDLLVVCHEGFSSLKNPDQPHTEGEIVSELTGSLDRSGAKYAFLYVSDPFNPIQYNQIGRLLAEATGNGSSNTTVFCDGVCQIKKSILEGLFVGIVLLIILISGLCCMAGIDTPTRFEAPQES